MSDTVPAEPAAAPEPSARDGAIPETPAPSNDFSIPEEFAEKGWASKIKSQDDLFKAHDSLSSMLNERKLPTQDSTPEEWEEFHNKMRPETASAYELTLPEGVEAEIDGELQAKYKEGFHKLGLTPQQAQGLFELDTQLKIEGLEADKDNQPTSEEIDAEFDKMAAKRFLGKEADAIKAANAAFTKMGSDFQDTLRKVHAGEEVSSNEVLIAMMEQANYYQTKFGKEDGVPKEGDPAPAQTLDEKVRRSNELRRSAEIKDPFHKDNKALREELKNLDDEIRRLAK